MYRCRLIRKQIENIFKKDFECIIQNRTNTTTTNVATQQKILKLNNNENLVKNDQKIIKPLEHHDFFNVRGLVNLKQLYDHRAHYGHHIGLRNPWMTDYIFGTRLDTDIIDLEKTQSLFKDALNFLAHVVFRKGMILFVTREPASIPLVDNLAKETGEYSHCREWMRGTLSDSVHRFKTVVRLPDLVVFLNTNDSFNEQHPAVHEAANMLIPTIGIVDTNTDPNLISYPIPGNDDTLQSIELYCDLFKKTILAAKEKRVELEKQNIMFE